MPRLSIFEILDLSEETLRRILPKASARTLIQLVFAYPRTVGRNFMAFLEGSVSAQTMQFIREQMTKSENLSMLKIREAEEELSKIIESEHITTSNPPS